MSPPIWLRDSNLTEKKSLKNTQVRNFSAASSKRQNDNQMISDLLAELQTIMTENAKFQSENESLRIELSELQDKYNGLIESIQSNKSRFEIDLNKLQDEIKNNEAQLLDNSKKCLQQQKKYVQEVKKLKSEKEKLQLDIAKNETEFTEKIKNLESELKLLQLSHDTVKSQNEENAQRSTKYKSKLKYAVTIINDLNNMLVQCTAKPNISHRETQTEDGKSNPVQDLHTTQSCTVPVHQSCTVPAHQNCTIPQHQPNLETENLLLSEVFFKSRAFCDNELLLFNEKESTFNFEDIPKTKLDI